MVDTKKNHGSTKQYITDRSQEKGVRISVQRGSVGKITNGPGGGTIVAHMEATEDVLDAAQSSVCGS